MDIDLPFHRAWLNDDDEIQEVINTLKSGWLTTGPKTHQFEEDFKDYIGCKHAIGLNSCTAGLHLSLVALGFEPGSEVISTPMTFPATANVVVHERLRPVFVDIEPGTLNIDPAKIEEKISSKTKAIFPVHFAGHPCDMDSIQAIADKHNLIVIEDAAHALESSYKGRKIGNLGHLTSFSFYANKNLTTGEGGMLTVNDDELAEKIRVLRLHGLRWHNEALLLLRACRARCGNGIAGEDDIVVAPTRDLHHAKIGLLPVNPIGRGEIGHVRRMTVQIHRLPVATRPRPHLEELVIRVVHRGIGLNDIAFTPALASDHRVRQMFFWLMQPA